jgi:hypothetical protein
MTASRKTPRSRSAISKRNRQRGAELERQVAQMFSEYLGRPVKRTLGQARDSGCDVHPPGPLVIECKRRQSVGPVAKWMAQAEADTDRAAGKLPVVVTRGDGNTKPMLTMYLEDFLDVMTRAMFVGTELWN